LVFFLSFTFWLGCSSKDEEGPTGPDTSAPPRVVADDTIASPGMLSADEPVWGFVAKYSVPIKSENSPKVVASQAQTVPDSVYVQAVSDPFYFYLRIEYTDDSLNLLKDYLYCHDPAEARFTLNESANEDQVFVMFAGLPDSAWDVWNWRSLGTGSVGLAEDLLFTNDVLVADSGAQQPTIQNDISGQWPRWVHNTGPAFHGQILHAVDTSSIIPFVNSTWEQNQIVPGYIVDTSVLSKVQEGQPYASSRWDVFSIYSYNSAENRMAVVFKRKKVVTYSQDMDLIDSVKIKIGILNDHDDFYVGGSRRGFTDSFWLIL
jgi:hypothetical protein